MKKMSGMATRIVVGAFIGGIVAAAFLLGGAWLWAVLYLCFLVAIYEMHAAFQSINANCSVLPAILFAVGMPPAIHWLGLSGVFAVYLVACMFALAVNVFRANIEVANTGYTLFLLFDPCLMMTVLFLMLMTFPANLGPLAVLTCLVGPSFTDIVAYFVGVTVGKHRLCPTISPKKSVEGAVGGLLGGILGGLLLGLTAQPLFGVSINLLHFLVIGLLAGVFGQIGDLIASIVKRSTGIKDFGHVFPGHGGIMDRLDSILFVAPIVYIYFSLVIV